MEIDSNFAATVFDNIYKNDEFSDIIFELTSKTGANVKIPSNKAILASLCPKFKEIFYGLEKDNATIQIADVTAEAFEEFLQFFYKNKLALTAAHIAEVCHLIEKFNVPTCYGVCESFLAQSVSTAVAIRYYDLALTYNLSKETIDAIVTAIHKDPIGALQAICGCSKLVLTHILQSQKFNCAEVDIFDTAISWATDSLTKKGRSVSAENIRTELGDDFNCIRFPVMTSDEFLNCLKKYPNLLTHDEFIGILQYITNNEPLSPPVNFIDVPREFVNTMPDHVSEASTASTLTFNDNGEMLPTHISEYIAVLFERRVSAKNCSNGDTSIVRFCITDTSKYEEVGIFLTGFEVLLCEETNIPGRILSADVNGHFANFYFDELERECTGIWLAGGYCRYYCRFKNPIQIEAGMEYTMTATLYCDEERGFESRLKYYGFGVLRPQVKRCVKIEFPFKGESNRFLAKLFFNIEGDIFEN